MTLFTHSLNLVTLQTLQINSVAIVVFDCRHDLANAAWGREQYIASHIAGAHFAHLDTDLSGAMTGHNGRHPLPERATFIAWLAAHGVTPHTQIICYDQLDGTFAARLWWLCRWAGIASVAVLAGGFAGWVAAQGQTASTATPLPAPAKPWNLPALERVLRSSDIELNLFKSKSESTFQLVDARAPERFRGDNEPLDRAAGHIPGAINHFFKRNVLPTGEFAPDLRAQWLAVLGGQAPTELAHSCGSGVTACHNVLALHVAGFLQPHEASQVYAGSWSEWCSDPARPVAKGIA